MTTKTNTGNIPSLKRLALLAPEADTINDVICQGRKGSFPN